MEFNTIIFVNIASFYKNVVENGFANSHYPQNTTYHPNFCRPRYLCDVTSLVTVLKMTFYFPLGFSSVLELVNLIGKGIALAQLLKRVLKRIFCYFFWCRSLFLLFNTLLRNSKYCRYEQYKH